MSSVAKAASDPFPPASPGDLGFSPDLGSRLDAASGKLDGLHALVVLRAGHVVLERYYTAPDESWGRPLGTVTFGPETLHDLRSVTKSVVGLLYGIALDRGLVPPPDAPLLAQFPRYPDLMADSQRAGLTIRHALNMTMGMAWDENRPYTSPANSEIAMEMAPDRIRYVLEQPIIHPPGERWIYSGGAVALIGDLIATGTRHSLPAFAEQALFAPLGIDTSGWIAGDDGVASAASGLRLRARDLLRIGAMVLAGGVWQGLRVVSSAWLAASFAPAIAIGDGREYGRLWYLGQASAPAFTQPRRWMAGIGNGGQRLWLMPDADLAVVSFFGNYNRPDQSVAPLRIWREIVLPNLLSV